MTVQASGSDDSSEDETDTTEPSFSDEGHGSSDYFSRATRLPITLACTECKARNYKTTKSESSGAIGPLELKKFCKHCKKHTLHRETK